MAYTAAMLIRNFIMDLRDDGSARLSLSYKGGRQNGISRISYEVASSDLTQLVLFDGTIGLHAALGTSRPIALALDGLVLEYGSGDPAALTFERQLGFSSQSAPCPLQDFHAGLSEATDVCLARAETSRYGPVMRDILSRCPVPEVISARMDPDSADQIGHRLREMTLLILAEDVAQKGSALARNLRAKKTRDIAQGMIGDVFISLARELAPAAGNRHGGGSGKSLTP